MVEYSSVNETETKREFCTGSVRNESRGKGKPSLIPILATIRLSKHYENGSRLYGDRNWELGQPISEYFNSAYRHLLQSIGGAEDEDHLSACAWNILAIIETRERIEKKLLDASLDDLRGYNLFPSPNEESAKQNLDKYLRKQRQSFLDTKELEEATES